MLTSGVYFVVCACLLSFVLVVEAFDMLFQGPVFAKLFPAELALERLESSVDTVDVSVEHSRLTKLFPTLLALVKLQFLVNRLDM